MDVHLPSPVWSPTIPRMVSHLQNHGYFVPKDRDPFSNGCSPSTLSMVNHYTQDSHALAEEWSTTIPGMVINFPKTVTHHFQDGQLDLEFDSSTAQLVFYYFHLNQFRVKAIKFLMQIALFKTTHEILDNLLEQESFISLFEAVLEFLRTEILLQEVLRGQIDTFL